ncbi:MAG: gamma carbonic anhydrase family protein [Phycisphaerae bacterium]
MTQTSTPTIGRDVFIATTAYVGGDVTLGDQTVVMHQAVIRGDIASIRIGARSNIQDGAIIHTAHDTPLDIGDEVSIGHRAVVHGRSVGSRTLIGIGAIVLDHCHIGNQCIVAAGAVVPPGSRIPARSVVMGVPGRVIRDVGDQDLETIDEAVRNYIKLGQIHTAGRYPNIATP